MEKHATTRFNYENRDSELRYIQKYYLPQEIRDRIYPADIEGISRCFHDECELWNGCVPEKLPDCVITYRDIGMDKRIDGETARQVMLAYMAYHDECSAELTQEEEQAAINLNHWLIEWEKQLLARLIQISEAMERQVRSRDSWLTDYEIDVTVLFYARDDDPFSYEKTEESWKSGIECDSQLIWEMDLWPCRLPVSAADTAKEDYWGIGDRHDHNDFGHYYDEHERPERHCLTFHELYDHQHFQRKHMKRIGYVSTDIVVRHQNGISIDLSGEQPVAVMDEPKIRKHFVL
ncbi:MAG: hypothetical protein WCP20_09600 [Desulfuromonadales bacterium]